MPLQNRVDPFGALHALPARGRFTGNRGILHDPATRTLTGRRWTTKSWIVCTCNWKGRRRDVWGRNGPAGGAGWSELFFSDEVTALAAGHRPCFFCQRQKAQSFQRAFAAGSDLDTVTAPQIDAHLHAQRRLSSQSAPRRISCDENWPDGTMIEIDGCPFARRNGDWLLWRFEGYRRENPATRSGLLITPIATVNALRSGFDPVWQD